MVTSFSAGSPARMWNARTASEIATILFTSCISARSTGGTELRLCLRRARGTARRLRAREGPVGARADAVRSRRCLAPWSRARPSPVQDLRVYRLGFGDHAFGRKAFAHARRAGCAESSAQLRV